MMTVSPMKQPVNITELVPGDLYMLNGHRGEIMSINEVRLMLFRTDRMFGYLTVVDGRISYRKYDIHTRTNVFQDHERIYIKVI